MSTQRFSRHAWQWRLLSLVMVQLPLKGHVKEALRFMLRLHESNTFQGTHEKKKNLLNKKVYRSKKMEYTLLLNMFQNRVVYHYNQPLKAMGHFDRAMHNW